MNTTSHHICSSKKDITMSHRRDILSAMSQKGMHEHICAQLWVPLKGLWNAF
jgi:hypothetical protein